MKNSWNRFRLILTMLGLQIICLSLELQAQEAPLKLPDYTVISVPTYAGAKAKTTSLTLPMSYGTSALEALDSTSLAMLKAHKLKHVDLVYTDHPKGRDFTALNQARMLAMQALLEGSDASEINWRWVKQVDCTTQQQAKAMFHGMVLFFEPVLSAKEEKGGGTRSLDEKALLKQRIDSMESKVVLEETASVSDLENFLSGIGVKISNLKTNSEEGNKYMYFKEEEAVLGLKEGLLMTTGTAKNAIGPNDTGGKSEAISLTQSEDEDLQKLADELKLKQMGAGAEKLDNKEKLGKLFDACIIEFDIVAEADTLRFDYIFASEEYPEYLSYHDVFGFFVRGKGIKGVKNIAVLPGSEELVSVGNINPYKNSQYYIESDIDKRPKLFEAWQYDGFSKVLTAKIAVIPNETYHLKLAIADYSDSYYDSGIFIEGKGFRSKK